MTPKKEYPYHPILDRSWEYEVFTLSYHQSPLGEFEPFLDLTLKKEDIYRCFRFHGPQELEIEKGFPAKAGGFCIFDVSSTATDGLGVYVDDLKGGSGALRFRARDVVEIGQFARVDDSLKFE